MMAQVTGQSLYVQQQSSDVQGTEVGKVGEGREQRERLMDHRDELAAMVKATRRALFTRAAAARLADHPELLTKGH